MRIPTPDFAANIANKWLENQSFIAYI